MFVDLRWPEANPGAALDPAGDASPALLRKGMTVLHNRCLIPKFSSFFIAVRLGVSVCDGPGYMPHASRSSRSHDPRVFAFQVTIPYAGLIARMFSPLPSPTGDRAPLMTGFLPDSAPRLRLSLFTGTPLARPHHTCRYLCSWGKRLGFGGIAGVYKANAVSYACQH